MFPAGYIDTSMHVHFMYLRELFCFLFYLSGVRARKIAEANYRTDRAIERGRDVMSKRVKVYRERTEEEGEGDEIEVESDFIDDDEGES